MLKDGFLKYAREHSLIENGQRTLLTVSGGVDSMVMLHLFHECGFSCGVAHCNFQLRGIESDEDEVSVMKAAEQLGLPFYNRRFDTVGEMDLSGDSMEMTARRLRYAWFAELCDTYGYDRIAIAHHADDSIETFFINLLRGTGLRGLTGIRNINGRVIRPLSFASRKEILEYATAHRIPFREDSSNRSTKYLRNKIRLGIVPRLREISPSFTKTMDENLRRLTDAQRLIDHALETVRLSAVESADGYDIIHLDKIDPGYPRDFVIYGLLSDSYGFKGDTVEALCRCLTEGSSGRRFYSRDFVAVADRNRILVSRIDETDECEVEIAEDTERAYCGNSQLTFRRVDVDSVDSLALPENMMAADWDSLRFPLKLRRWREGDMFHPFGMNGSKKISDFLINQKVPIPEKRRQFVLVSGQDIVWLVGRRSDDRFKVTPRTESILLVTKETV